MKKLSEIYEAIINEGLDDVIKKHINAYSLKDDPYDVAYEIGQAEGWSEKKIEQAEKIIRKKYIK